MGRNHYGDGTKFENETKHFLKLRGFEVIRSAGSKGKIDLVAFRPEELLFIQCKLNGMCPPIERKKLRAFSAMVNAVPLVASAGDGSTTIRPVVIFRRLTGDGPYEYREWKING